MSATTLHSYGFGLATQNSRAEIIEVFYPQPQIKPDAALVAVLNEHGPAIGDNGYVQLDQSQQNSLLQALGDAGQSEVVGVLSQLRDSEQPVLLCTLHSDQPPQSVPEAYLKLHLLSHRLLRPHEVNLQGLFGVLHNLAWTNEGAIALDELPARQIAARRQGKVLDVQCVDKFPKMTNYVVPRGVRIADTARVRLGAYIGEGTTVMHEGFVNFNAGTLGKAMIEGRISAGVVVGEDSDLGGGCSTMGTLSGGGTEIISVGRNCLIGANAGIGFPLPDGCVIEAGLYVTAGTKISILDDRGDLVRTAKARELTTLTNHLYRRNSMSGAVECLPLKSQVALNEELHSHN
ncbi:MAG: tetrahydrodipicolinate N-succinyltransferase N-terminal domain-containing protein [Pseudohongiellaceae bacterium]